MIHRVPTWLTVMIATGAAALPACSSRSTDASSSTGAGGGTGGVGASASSTGACPTSGATGGSGGATSPLRVLGATLISGTEVRLVFSEAVKPPTGVDPAAFRLSAGEVLKPGRPSYTVYSMSGYEDVTLPPYSICPIADGDYGDGCLRGHGPACTETLYRDLGDFSKLEQTSDDEIVATLSAPIGSVGFRFLPCGGVFLHYAEASTPIEDLAGHRLEPIAPDWVHAAKPEVTVPGDAPRGPLAVDRSILDPYCSGKPCHDGLVDGNEADVDCGDIYTCPACGLGKHCSDPYGCASHACVGGVCTAASCSDAQRNGSETDVDCGGSTCPACPDGKGCKTASDCQSQHCAQGLCKP
ncbi:MAG TPA: hypothetical protein VHB21_24165 [Minicystis sp.]|nr:hypothetical protein [Minicystis sp.]